MPALFEDYWDAVDAERGEEEYAWAEPELRQVGDVVLFDHVYGSSYFGSGGASGSVRYENAAPIGTRDNGFVSGSDGFRVADPSQPARVVARGGDYINGGREWGETYEYTPGVGWRRVK